MSGGEGSSSTPPTPISSSAVPPISPFLPTGGIRYPFYAAVQGSPLLYSPIFGQAMVPWKSQLTGVSSPSAGSSTTQSSSSSSLAQSALVNVPNIPGLVYPLPTLGVPMLTQQGSLLDGKKSSGHESIKRRSESAYVETELKRPRLSESASHSPSLTSSSSHPSTPTHQHKTPQHTQQQRSPVIKFIQYNPGQSVVLPTTLPQSAVPTTAIVLPNLNINPGTGAILPTQHSPSSPTPQKQQHSQQQQHGVQYQPSSATQSPSSESVHLPKFGSKSDPHNVLSVPLSLPSHLRLVLLKCFGPISESVINQNNLIVSNLLQDLYRPSYFTTSNYSDLPLSPESCALLTICYLNSLRPGEKISIENLRTMMHYSQLGEMEWLHYYKKHKKMSESTFVQSQLMHLSRVAVYPVLGKIQVMISTVNLGDGIVLTLQNLAQQLATVPQQSLPDYLVILAMRASSAIDFCILMLEPLQVKLLQEQRLLSSAESKHRKQRLAKGSSSASSNLSTAALSSRNQEINISKDLLLQVRAFCSKLKGDVLIPFQNHAPLVDTGFDQQRFGSGQIKVPLSTAESLVPDTPHMIEHKPKGPFQNQYNVAMFLLQKILSGWGAQFKIKEFQRVDFRVLCPPDAVSMSQTIAEISSLIDILKVPTSSSPKPEMSPSLNGTSMSNCTGSPLLSGSNGSTSKIAEVQRRVICCCSRDSARFQAFLVELEANQSTLYVVVAECAHLTCFVTGSDVQNTTDSTYFSDNTKLLCSLPNCILLSVSSHPYSLQSNRSLISFANEVNWPMETHSNDRFGMEFCSVIDYQSSKLPNSMSKYVEFREDQPFEEVFCDAAVSPSSSSESVATLRAQLLINQYITALLVSVGQLPCSVASTLTETQTIVNQLVHGPLSNTRGYGSMVLIRSHDQQIGRQFYQRLKSVRDALGLQYRFEVIYDDGSQLLTIGSHFKMRITKWGTHGQSNAISNPSNDSISSYKELENLPCVVILAGSVRAEISMPSSLCFVDLRLCYPLGHVTRTCYEYDISFLNGYYKMHNQEPTTENVEDKQEVMDTTVAGNDSDSEVFERDTSTTRETLRNRMSSSSSSRKSSFTDDLQDGSAHTESGQDDSGQQQRSGSAMSSRTGVVEWKPDVKDVQNGEQRRSSSGVVEVEGERESPLNESEFGGTVTVTIDPPNDLYSDSSATRTHCSGGDVGGIPFHSSESKDDDFDLFGSLDDAESDSEGEESDPYLLKKLCLLSRPYYHIWSSHNKQQHLLLQPAQGVNWHGGHRRPPLFVPDPHQQSGHYRKWTKPATKEVKTKLDGIMKEANKNSRRRFLLTGPPKVGKTGAWLLMVRLLHDHLCSSQGITVENPSPVTTIFLPDTFSPPSSSTRLSSKGDSNIVPPLLSTVGLKHSRIVPLKYLEGISKYLGREEHLSKNDLKSFVLPFPGEPPSKTTAESSSSNASLVSSTNHTLPRHVVSLPVSTYMAYDFTHSCTECSKYLRGTPSSIPEVLTSNLPVTAAGGTEQQVLIKWSIPSHQLKHCVVSSNRKTLERLKLLTLRNKGEKAFSYPLTPIFTPTLGRDSSGLLNLFHSSFQHLHVLVTTSNQFNKYCKAWPNHIIMALPDEEAVGLGSTYHLLKEFVQHNYLLNVSALHYEVMTKTVWPLVAFMSDNVVMWRKMSREENRVINVSLSEVLKSFEQPECLQYAAMSALPWSKQVEEGYTGEELTDYDLSHDFIVLNLQKVASVSYNEYTYNSAEVGFNLLLKASDMKTKLRKDVSFMRKHLPSGGNLFPLHLQISGLCPDIDKVVISLHHDSSSHLPYPGPYLMEHYLLHKSHSLFPYAHNPQYPVLIVENYINLGPQTNVTFIKLDAIDSNNFDSTATDNSKTDNSKMVQFSGLMVYLCEGKLNSKQLNRMNFLPGACLCLVTRDCKSLVREVARLDLEERWKFRLRDEYQTACADNMKPLFFLTGTLEG